MSNDEEWKTRNALLQYYSSLTAAQGIRLLTLALIALTVVEVRSAFPPLRIQCMSISISALAIAAIVTLLVRGFGRMMFLGYLSHAILMVPESLGRKVEKDTSGGLGRMVADGYCASPFTEMLVLHLAAVEWIGRYKGIWSSFGSLSHWRCWIAPVIVGLFTFLFLLASTF